MAASRPSLRAGGAGADTMLMDEFHFQMDILLSSTGSITAHTQAVERLMELVSSSDLKDAPLMTCTSATFNKLAIRLQFSEHAISLRIAALGLLLLESISCHSSSYQTLDCFSISFLESVVEMNSSSRIGVAPQLDLNVYGSPGKVPFHHKRKFAVSTSVDKSCALKDTSFFEKVLMTLRCLLGVGMVCAPASAIDGELLQLAFVNRYFHLLVGRITALTSQSLSGDEAPEEVVPDQDSILDVAEEQARLMERQLSRLRRVLGEAQCVVYKARPHIMVNSVMHGILSRMQRLREEPSASADGAMWLAAGIVDNTCFLNASAQRTLMTIWENTGPGAHPLAHLLETVATLLPQQLRLSSGDREVPAGDQASVLRCLFDDICPAGLTGADVLLQLLRTSISLLNVHSSPTSTLTVACPRVLLEVVIAYLPTLQSIVCTMGDCIQAMSAARALHLVRPERSKLPLFVSVRGPMSDQETSFERLLFDSFICLVSLLTNAVDMCTTASKASWRHLGFSFASVACFDPADHRSQLAGRMRRELSAALGCTFLSTTPPRAESGSGGAQLAYANYLLRLISILADSFLQDLEDTDAAHLHASTQRHDFSAGSFLSVGVRQEEEGCVRVPELMISAHLVLHLVELLQACGGSRSRSLGADSGEQVHSRSDLVEALMFMICRGLPRGSSWQFTRVVKAHLALQQQAGSVLESAVRPWLRALKLLESYSVDSRAPPMNWQQRVAKLVDEAAEAQHPGLPPTLTIEAFPLESTSFPTQSSVIPNPTPAKAASHPLTLTAPSWSRSSLGEGTSLTRTQSTPTKSVSPWISATSSPSPRIGSLHDWSGDSDRQLVETSHVSPPISKSKPIRPVTSLDSLPDWVPRKKERSQAETSPVQPDSLIVRSRCKRRDETEPPPFPCKKGGIDTSPVQHDAISEARWRSKRKLSSSSL